ncbi:hypothetical protein RPC_2043 [Rhodopseudomonas palustris BisB18]|uniref:Uncharacterized protein n=1 Tax=Rhodopseudomonas palustris (strain BisB18) TaxID=316056 RepID=Q216T8_RHOPB
MSERRACKAVGCCRMTMRYKTTRSDEAGLRLRMKAIAHERRRFGYSNCPFALVALCCGAGEIFTRRRSSDRLPRRSKR